MTPDENPGQRAPSDGATDHHPDGVDADPQTPDSADEQSATDRMGVLARSESFSFAEAVGGWRGLAESVAPGIVFVAAYLVWGGFRIPVIAAVGTVVVLVVARLVQRSTVQQAVAGVVGVGIGAVWAWRSGDAGDFYVPGMWLGAAYLLALLASMAVRWPLVGVVVGLLKGTGTAWRQDPRTLRTMQLGTALFAGMYVIRLAVQVPLYLAGAVAALGTAKLITGVPLFALTLWVVWLLVRNAAPDPAPQDPPPPTR